ncbi:Retrovirus-related Pol polyprotein from transposon opus, partial [Mucuna pruriens]
MDRIFNDHIGNQVEVYVDDMVIKSKMKRGHVSSLVSVFEVRADKFLGFVLTQRGIEANPKKCQAVINMKSPSSVKEVQ